MVWRRMVLSADEIRNVFNEEVDLMADEISQRAMQNRINFLNSKQRHEGLSPDERMELLELVLKVRV